MSAAAKAELALGLNLIDQGYDARSWHGPNLRSALRRVSAEAAVQRTAADRKNIAEQALHAAYWKYVVCRWLTGAKRGSFPLKGSNWFPVDGPLSEADWKAHLGLLAEQHKQLRAAVEGLDPRRLHEPAGDPAEKPDAKRPTYWALISGVALHDVYHAGQIRHIRATLGI